ncbi:unnamed protein product [Soboliphyme baturini]|uniref:Mitochondrial carrier protein n=1 Tax=Soboliphyme baturini TaxID=241478 RepID=A0A183IND6_9BILA|nr:unnamed protein product [Soboliphyme baturini]
MKKSNPSKELSIYERFAAGSIAGSLSQSVIYPLEVLKTRLALRRTYELSEGIVSALRQIYHGEGWRAFYCGYLPNMLGIIPYAGIDLGIYETMKRMYATANPEKVDPSILVLLGCGTTSTICGQLACYPLALVRTRLQANRASRYYDQPSTMVGQFTYILRNEGVTGLYRGLTPNFMKVVPAVGVSYVVYETVRKRFGATMT